MAKKNNNGSDNLSIELPTKINNILDITYKVLVSFAALIFIAAKLAEVKIAHNIAEELKEIRIGVFMQDAWLSHKNISLRKIEEHLDKVADVLRYRIGVAKKEMNSAVRESRERRRRSSEEELKGMQHESWKESKVLLGHTMK